jgi:hypothetical protein
MFQDNINLINEFNNHIHYLEKAIYKYCLKYNEIIDSHHPINNIFIHYKNLENIKYGINIDINYLYDIHDNFSDIYKDIHYNINNLSSTKEYINIKNIYLCKNQHENRIERIIRLLINLINFIHHYVIYLHILNYVNINIDISNLFGLKKNILYKYYIKNIFGIKNKINNIINLLNQELHDVLYIFIPSLSNNNKLLIKFNTFIDYFHLIQCNKMLRNIYINLVSNSNIKIKLINKDLAYVMNYYYILDDLLINSIINFTMNRIQQLYLDTLD